MDFYQLKLIRKGTKPPVWRRAYVPVNSSFSQLAVMLLSILEIKDCSSFEIESYLDKERFLDGKEAKSDWEYMQYDASKSFIACHFKAGKAYSFRTFCSAPEYRIEVECVCDVVGTHGESVCRPAIVKQVSESNDKIWTDANIINKFLEERFVIKEGNVQYKTMSEIIADVYEKGAGLTVCNKPKDFDNLLSLSIKGTFDKVAGRIKEEMQGQENNEYDDTDFSLVEEAKARIEELKAKIDVLASEIERLEKAPDNAPLTRRFPTLPVMMKSFTGKQLIEIADNEGLVVSSSSKQKVVNELSRYLLTASTMKMELYMVDDDELALFERIIDEGICKLTDEELERISVFRSIFYVAVYKDHCAEVPKEAVVLYDTIVKHGYKEKRDEVRWMICCLDAYIWLHSVAPFKVIADMFRRKYRKASDEQVLEVFDTVPDLIQPCVIQDGMVISRDLYDDGLFNILKKRQRDVPYYIPTTEGIVALARDEYTSDEKPYIDFKMQVMKYMEVDEEQANRICLVVYKAFLVGLMPSECMKRVNESLGEEIVFSSQKYAEEFSKAFMNIYSNSRKFDLRGHSPNEMSSLRKETKKQPFIPYSKNASDGFPVAASGTFTAGGIKSENAERKIYPNDPCPCGSGKKYKKCCGK